MFSRSSGGRASLVSQGKLSPWLGDGHLLTVSPHIRERERLSGVHSYEGTNPITGPNLMTSSNPDCLPKAPRSGTITLGVGASTWELGEGEAWTFSPWQGVPKHSNPLAHSLGFKAEWSLSSWHASVSQDNWLN